LDAKTPLLRKLRDLYALGMRNQLGGVYHCSSLSYELLMLACDEFLPCSYIKNDVKFIPLVISFCVENIGKKISIDDMASVANLSRFHFGRLFKESQGVSPGIFLNNLRMKNALKLIQTEVLSVKEISEICGFEDSSYFCKVFKKCFGTSPEKYRRGKR
jgi:AraC-like DNA-binding protein